MSDDGDYDTEMFRRSDLDDTAIERLLAGHHVDGQEMLVSFVEDAQLAASRPGPMPDARVAACFAREISTDNGDLLVTVGSNVSGPGQQVAGLPKWRKKNVIEIALAKLGALGLAAKVGIATGALALSGTAAAFSGALPPAAQDSVADAFDRAGINIPGGRSAEHRQDGNHRQDGEQGEDADTRDDADFGTRVADDAKTGATREDGAQFGEDVSNDARETRRPAGTPTADSNPGTEGGNDAGGQAPETAPTADSNPGTDYRDDAGAQAPDSAPTEDDNPGTSRRP